jgi:hypothetical protein
MASTRPDPSEYAPYYGKYIGTVADGDIIELLEAQQSQLAAFARRVSPDRETFRYADGKWSVREVIGHLTDAERVFGYRLLCISRGQTAPLPGFDENQFVAESHSNERPLRSLVDELVMVRETNLIVMRTLTADAWQRLGSANNAPVSPRALAYIMAGHINHHLALFRDRYGIHD